MPNNSVERTLAIKITPRLDIEALTKQIQEAVSKAMLTMDATPHKTEHQSDLSVEDKDKPEKHQDKKKHKSREEGEVVSDTTGGGEEGGEESSSELDKEKTVKAVKSVGSVVKTGFGLAQQTFQGIFGIIQEIHNRVKQASMFLETVENLFNLAMTLLLMPLGNALAETILPMTVELVDSVIGLWDQFDQFAGEGDLAGIITLVMDKGLKLIGEYFTNIGDIFKDSGNNLLESVGELFEWMGNFLESGRLAKLLSWLFDIFKVFADHIEVWIPMIIGYQIAQLGATIGAAAGPGIGSVLAMAGAGIGFAGGYLAGDMLLNNADGGHYPQTSGGTAIRVAEQEDEYVIPASKLTQMVGGSNNITNNFYGYTLEELKQTVREVLQEEVSNSQFRSGL